MRTIILSIALSLFASVAFAQCGPRGCGTSRGMRSRPLEQTQSYSSNFEYAYESQAVTAQKTQKVFPSSTAVYMVKGKLKVTTVEPSRVKMPITSGTMYYGGYDASFESMGGGCSTGRCGR